MKKIILLSTILITSLSIAQNTLPTTGNVGIGTANPLYALDVYGGGRFKVPDDKSGIGGLTIETLNGPNLKMGGNSTYSWIQSHMSLPLYVNELGNNTILNLTHGNVGIGTISPDTKLTVNGDVKVKQSLFISGSSGGYTTGDNPVLYFGVADDFAKINIPFGDKMIFSSYHGYTFSTSYNGATAIPSLTIGITGDVGIGTTNPDAKLAVNGTIHSKEVKVDLNVPAPDYVFAPEYELRTLQEVEKYVKQNNHLPEIPSAKEFEENGIQLAEMNMALLKKVEELTLYIIKLEKNHAELEKRILNIEIK